MRRQRRASPQKRLNAAVNVRSSDGLYITLDASDESDYGGNEDEESFPHTSPSHSLAPLAPLFPAGALPVHIFDKGKRDRMFASLGDKVKVMGRPNRRLAWVGPEDSSSGGEESTNTKITGVKKLKKTARGTMDTSSPPPLFPSPPAAPLGPRSPPTKKLHRLPASSSSSPSTVTAHVLPHPAISSPVHDAQIKPLSLRLLHKSLVADHESARMQLLHHADGVVRQLLPLRYLLSKPELRHYAVEKVVRPFMRLLVLKTNVILRRALLIWRRIDDDAEIKMNEKQARFMVLADCLAKLLRSLFLRTFNHWAWHYSSRRSQLSGNALKHKAASDIQRWYRHVRITCKDSFKRFTEAVQTCLHRRKAIKHFIQFEQSRRLATGKIRRAIFRKRCMHYSARALGRVWRWVKLLRKVQWKLTRSLFVRRLQRWYRMVKCRPVKELFIIHFVIKCGGYSVVRRKLNSGHLERNGFLLGVDATVTQIQRAWYKSRGQFALFLMFAARRAKLEYEQMLNENATIIQQNFRGHLWNLLFKAAVQHNRARRISKGHRSYQYRHAWYRQGVVVRQNRMARKIQGLVRRFMERRFLMHRFRLRKAFLIFTRAKKTLSAMSIQRQYRAHVERERIKKEILVAFIAGQRAKAALVAKNISTIQRNFRQFVTKTFPEHVKLVCWRLVSQARERRRLAALKIQGRGKTYIKKQIKKRNRLHKRMANRIWRFAKARLLALTLWDRVEARRLLEKLASTCMQRKFRLLTFCRIIKTRCILRKATRDFRTLCFNHATYIQRWMRRKTIEYVLPVRLAGRRQLKKKRDLEEVRRELQKQLKAARFLVRFFRLWPAWSRNLQRIHVEFVRIKRHRAAKKMQKFGKRVIAWARFARVVAYKKKCVLEEELKGLQMSAANMVGHYWQRFREKRTLAVRFRNRRAMLDEWHRLEELRLKAMKERAWALEEKRRTDENMAATIAASWKQGADTTGKNYYYNYVTGESMWTAPEGWKTPVAVDKWIRQLDSRGCVYYYNMQSEESSWLPPCGICGGQPERHCEDCSMAYCETCYEARHTGDEAEEEDWKDHKWALVEYEKQKLGPGDVYCIECKKRIAKRMCLTCWDPYCDECFSYTHHTGDLKYHKTMTYKKVKVGWMVVKSKDVETDDGGVKLGDYYINGTTGEVTYEKPLELFTAQELLFYTNFKSHQAAAEGHIKKIEELQYKLEETAYERDSMLQDALAAGMITGAVSNVLKKRTKKKAESTQKDVIAEVKDKNKPGAMSWLLGDQVEYKKTLLTPKDRVRGGARASMMKALLDEGDAISAGVGAQSKKK